MGPHPGHILVPFCKRRGLSISVHRKCPRCIIFVTWGSFPWSLSHLHLLCLTPLILELRGQSSVSVTPVPPVDSSSVFPGSLLPQDTCTSCSLCLECCSSALPSPVGLFLSLLGSTGMSHLPHHTLAAILSNPTGCSPTPPC